MELDYFSAKQSELIKMPPLPAKTAEPEHPLQQLPQVLGNHAFGAQVSTSIKRFRFWYLNRTNAPGARRRLEGIRKLLHGLQRSQDLGSRNDGAGWQNP